MTIEAEFLAATFVAMLSIIGTLALLGIRDIGRRINKLERQDEKLFAAVTTLLVAKSDDHGAMAAALHGLLTNGVGH